MGRREQGHGSWVTGQVEKRIGGKTVTLRMTRKTALRARTMEERNQTDQID
jgi:hypothetical protein